MDKYNKKTGFEGEDLACRYLEKLGYKIIGRNYLIRGGEIDIVCQDGEWLVFVEVKARYSHEYGLPGESITYYKIKAMLRSALVYVNKVGWGNRPYRLDAVLIDYTKDRKNPEIELVKNITG